MIKMTNKSPQIKKKKTCIANLIKSLLFSCLGSVCPLKGFHSILSVILALVFFTGCSSFDVPKYQYMSEELPQVFQLPVSAEKVWRIVSEEADLHSDCKLAKSSKDRMISWCEKIEKWRDLGQDTVGPKNYEKLARKAEEGTGTAVTTIWIEDFESGSKLHVRRVYYSSQSFSGLGHSRGDYERDLYQRILERMGLTKANLKK